MEVCDISFDSNDEDTSGDDFLDSEDEDQELRNNNQDEIVKDCCEKFKSWQRKRLEIQTPPSKDGNKINTFYLLDCDAWASPIANFQDGNANLNATSSAGSVRTHVIRLFGLAKDGRTVCCFVHGFLPHLYVICSGDLTQADAEQFQSILNFVMLNELSVSPTLVSYSKYVSDANPPVVKVEIVEYSDQIYNYHSPRGNAAKTILKVSCLLTKFVPLASRLIDKGLITYPFQDQVPCRYKCYEHNLNPSVRFLTSLNISCCTWLEFKEAVPVDKEYSEEDAKRSHADIEIDIVYTNLEPGKTTWETEDPKANTIPPPDSLRILSFDIECMVRPPKFDFPTKGKDRVLQIGNVLFSTGNTKMEPVKVIFALGVLEPIPGAEIFSFDNEVAMLNAWKEFVLITDPDVIAGYNICIFDIPFLLARAEVLNAKAFPYFSRIVKTPVTYRSVLNEHKRITEYTKIIPGIPGRVVLDMYPILRQTFPGEASHKLEAVARSFLSGEFKDDVSYKDIFLLQNRSPATRSRLAKYCLQDAWLVSRLILVNPSVDEEDECNFINFYCRHSSMSGSPLRYHLTKSKFYITNYKTIRMRKHPHIRFPALPSTGRKRSTLTMATGQADKVKRALFPEDNASGENPSTSSVSKSSATMQDIAPLEM